MKLFRKHAVVLCITLAIALLGACGIVYSKWYEEQPLSPGEVTKYFPRGDVSGMFVPLELVYPADEGLSLAYAKLDSAVKQNHWQLQEGDRREPRAACAVYVIAHSDYEVQCRVDPFARGKGLRATVRAKTPEEVVVKVITFSQGYFKWRKKRQQADPSHT